MSSFKFSFDISTKLLNLTKSLNFGLGENENNLGKRKDPYLSYCFLLEIDGLISCGFSEVSGLQAEVETEDYQEGGMNDFVHKLTKGTKYSNIVLKRGITDSEDLWNWHKGIINGNIVKKSIRIILLEHDGQQRVKWVFKEAYPVKWVGPEFKADNNSVAIESLDLVHKGIEKY